MKNILIIGAGRSSSSLIKYLLDHSNDEGWKVHVGDTDLKLAQQKTNNHKNARAFEFNAMDKVVRRKEIAAADIVISMLPAMMHFEVVKDCVELKKNVLTPSYVSSEIKSLHAEAQKQGVIILNELGVDPGIDHMSAKRILDKIYDVGGQMLIFESFTGGLVAPESDNNPWNYKFTWNPRNVVIAGQGGAAKFIHAGQYKYIPYHKLFRRTEIIKIEGHGKFEGYANRDSLYYRDLYDLHDIPTFYRGTLRRVGFCRAWDVFVQLGCTDDSYVIENSENMTYREFINTFLAYHPHDSVELKLRHYLKIDQDDEIMEKFEWLGIYEHKKIGLKRATPAQILQHILEQKWKLDPNDKDMIVMWHKLTFKLKDEIREISSSMVVKGVDQTYTAMSNTVGLPLGISAKLVLNGKITLKGVQWPIVKEIYDPVLEELEKFDIVFTEKEVQPKLY
ncbi:MAG TPA: saccharopine dehydrogenase C-terminal domain-containing protein [Flavobacteriales bacterium]|nr:saccharopine dehydrogenase C-terminal domain-containing protein [Flavobacteriales bacterium]